MYMVTTLDTSPRDQVVRVQQKPGRRVAGSSRIAITLYSQLLIMHSDVDIVIYEPGYNVIKDMNS